MKTSIKTIILAAASIFAAMSCQKEAAVPETQSPENAGETIQVNINASLGDFVAADGTKATATQVVRLTWESSDQVDAYYGETKINSQPIDVNPSQNGIFAKLSGSITIQEGMNDESIITFVYSNVTGDGLTFDFSSQNATIPFVAYATVKYGDLTSNFSDKMVEFKFATSVMKIVATNLGGGNITGATISGINTKVTLTPDDDSEACGIRGDNKAGITTSNYAASSDGTRAIVTVGLVPDNITVGLVPDNNTGRNITVTQTDFTNKGAITSAKIISNTSYTTPVSLFPCGTQDGHDYVLIAGTKWATQNLAITSSGQSQWLSNVYLPGTTTPVQIGDYFQWGAHENYTTEENSDKGLLIYKEFTNNGSTGSFTWKKDGSGKGYQFGTTSISPYYESDAYTYYEGDAYQKYTIGDSGDGIVTLTPSDDVASILWSDPWRMPTSAEFQALTNATYWAWDGMDKGYYVYAPQPGDAGKNNNETTNTYDKSSALLFFPAAGNGNGTGLYAAGFSGSYWSSSLNSGRTEGAYYLNFDSEDVFPKSGHPRYFGHSVRPVSD